MSNSCSDSQEEEKQLDKDITNKLKRRSLIWNYYKSDSKTETAVCLSCNSEICFKGRSLTNLSKHLKSKHSLLYSEYEINVNSIYTNSKRMKKSIENINTTITFEQLVEELELQSNASAENKEGVPKLASSDYESYEIIEVLDSSINEPETISRRRSLIWNYYQRIVEKNEIAFCLACKKEISFRGGTISNLSKHLRRKHPTLFCGFKSEINFFSSNRNQKNISQISSITLDNLTKDIQKENTEEEEASELLGKFEIVPLTKCSTRRNYSPCWDYFGHLMEGDLCVDDKSYYCCVCFKRKTIKQYSANSSNSNLFHHLKKFHKMNIDRDSHSQKKQKTDSNQSPSLSISKEESEAYENYQILESYNNNDFINIKQEKKALTFQKDNEKNPIAIEKNKATMPKVTKLKLNNIKQNSERKNKTYEENVKEAETEVDCDRLFVLSLLKEFKKIPDSYRLRAKSDLINVLVKYEKICKPKKQRKKTISKKIGISSSSSDDFYSETSYVAEEN